MTELNDLTNINLLLHFKFECRLLKSAKSEIGIIGKHYIEKINSNIRKITNMNQWQKMQAVIAWFKPIENKRRSSFIKLDIVDFYPSISKELLTKSINYAKSITTIEEEEVITTAFHARK